VNRSAEEKDFQSFGEKKLGNKEGRLDRTLRYLEGLQLRQFSRATPLRVIYNRENIVVGEGKKKNPFP